MSADPYGPKMQAQAMAELKVMFANNERQGKIIRSACLVMVAGTVLCLSVGLFATLQPQLFHQTVNTILTITPTPLP